MSSTIYPKHNIFGFQCVLSLDLSVRLLSLVYGCEEGNSTEGPLGGWLIRVQWEGSDVVQACALLDFIYRRLKDTGLLPVLSLQHIPASLALLRRALILGKHMWLSDGGRS